jgi:hypothetical protein
MPEPVKTSTSFLYLMLGDQVELPMVSAIEQTIGNSFVIFSLGLNDVSKISSGPVALM